MIGQNYHQNHEPPGPGGDAPCCGEGVCTRRPLTPESGCACDLQLREGRNRPSERPVGSPGPRRLVDVREVGRLLACAPRTVYRLADEGRIPWGVKLGALRRWDLHEVEEFIAGGCKPARKGDRR
jgi:excisionase family DNA binding protein